MKTLEYVRAHLAAGAFGVPLSFDAALAPGQAPRTFWAGRWYRDKDQYQKFHYAITGTTRAGKSKLLTLYIRSILPRITPHSNQRLLLFDPKNALHPLLFTDAKVPVYFLLPSDLRSSPWWISRDVKSPADVMSFNEAMVPELPGDKDGFFRNALLAIQGAVVDSLNVTHPDAWDLTALVPIMERRDYQEQVLSRTYATRSKLRLMKEPRTWANIEATIEATVLNRLRIMAALWSRATRRSFSLTDFVEGEGILVLGRDPKYGALLDPINTLIFRQLFSRLLSQNDSPTRRTYIVIDELAVAGGEGKPLQGLKELAEQGASRGVVLVVAYQSYADVKALYKESGDAVLGMLQNQVFLRAGDTPTAEFAAKAFGKTREWIKTTSNTTTSGVHGSSSLTRADHYHEVDAVPYEKFLELPNASPQRGITGYWLSPPPLRTATPFHLPGWWIAKNLPPPSDVEPYLQRPDRHQYLEPFSYRDLRRLRLTPPEDEGEAKVVLPKGAVSPPRERPATLPKPAQQDDMAGKLRWLIGRPLNSDEDHDDDSTN